MFHFNMNSSIFKQYQLHVDGGRWINVFLNNIKVISRAVTKQATNIIIDDLKASIHNDYTL